MKRLPTLPTVDQAVVEKDVVDQISVEDGPAVKEVIRDSINPC